MYGTLWRLYLSGYLKLETISELRNSSNFFQNGYNFFQNNLQEIVFVVQDKSHFHHSKSSILVIIQIAEIYMPPNQIKRGAVSVFSATLSIPQLPRDRDKTKTPIHSGHDTYANINNGLIFF